MNKQLMWLWLLIYILFLLGCRKFVDRVQGKYVANHKYGHDSIFINADHSFHQSFQDRRGQIFYNEGLWKVNDGKIEFDKFIWFIPGLGPTDRRQVFWIANYNNPLFRSERIIINQDLDLAYIKFSNRSK